jgi:hypothetical protein
MAKRFALLNQDKTRVMNVSLCEDYESAIAFHGEGIAIEITESTGDANFGYYWDGQVFTYGDCLDLIPEQTIEEVTEPVVE